MCGFYVFYAVWRKPTRLSKSCIKCVKRPTEILMVIKMFNHNGVVLQTCQYMMEGDKILLDLIGNNRKKTLNPIFQFFLLVSLCIFLTLSIFSYFSPLPPLGILLLLFTFPYCDLEENQCNDVAIMFSHKNEWLTGLCLDTIMFVWYNYLKMIELPSREKIK